MQYPKDNETIVEQLSHVNKHGDSSFFAYWKDDYLPPNGVRGQIFLCNATEKIEKWRIAGDVTIIGMDGTITKLDRYKPDRMF